jgi:hypothetical protein
MGNEKNETGRMRRVIALFVAATLSCALAQGGARAQSLKDPMRPADAAPGSSGTPAAAAAPRLQAVITSPTRKLAVIDGAVVPIGAPVRGGTLAGISDSVAVLQKNGERDVLLMHPNIHKRPARAPDTKVNAP